jgi:hypothetical protein
MMINHRKKVSPSNKSATTTKLKSLNLQFRRKEAERIINENELIAKRIKTQRPQINKKRLDKDFEQYQKYKEQVSKLRLLKYQEIIRTRTPEFRGKNITPNSDIEKGNREKEFEISHVFARKTNHFGLELSIEDDSSYEEDFD